MMWRVIASRWPILFLLGTYITAVAQYRVDTWTTDDGLPQKSVFSILQTRDGYLWLTTFDGLVRFDGVRFTVFNKSNTKGLSTNRFTALHEDQDGVLWIGTGEGGLTRYRDGVFASDLIAGEATGEIFGFERDLNGELLIRTRRGQFYLRDHRLIAAPAEYQTLDKKLYLAPSGTQWTITNNGTTQLSGGKTTKYALKVSFANALRPYEDKQENLWFGESSGLYRLRDGQITHYTEQSGLPSRARVYPACEDDEGGVWFVAGNALGSIGLLRFKDERFTLYGENSGLKSQTINGAFKDREGTIWLGSSRGLHRVTKQFINGYSTANGLLRSEVYPILQSRNGNIWVGSIFGLSRFKEGVFSNTPLPEPFNIVQALAEDRAGRLWIGIVDGLLLLENGKLKNLSSLLGNLTVPTILTDRNGYVWIGTGQGLFKFDGEHIAAHYTTKHGLPRDDVAVIYEDRHGSLWIGTPGALAEFKDGQFISHQMTAGAGKNHVRSIYEDADGTFWIGTYDDGLFRFRAGSFFNYRMEHGLFNNGVFQILEDRHGYFWISCNRGIYRVSRRELNDLADGKLGRLNSIAYGKQDGMLNIECNGGRLPAGIIAHDGKFWFPTQEGVAVIDPEAASINPQPPPVLIESVALERAPVDFRGSVTIQPGQRDLEIQYTGLSYLKPEQIKFRYKLEGLNNEWVEAGPRRTAYFPYLPPGSYTFRVIAANSDGVWNETGVTIPVIVHAPFWLRWWFWGLCFVAVAGVAVFAIRRRFVRLQRKHAEREAFARQLIDSHENERKRLAGELHDSLGQNLIVTKNWALLGLNTVAEDNPAREYLTEISETASLALNEVREIAHNLRPYQLERLGLTHTIENMVDHVNNSTGIEFITDLDNIDDLLSKDSEINLYRVVQECVNNVVKHSDATTMWLSLRRIGNGVQIICRDNGRGFDPRAKSSSNGFGLSGMTERVQMLNGRYVVDSAAGKGTTIRITINRKEVPA